MTPQLKGPEDYSSNPSTIRARRRKDKLQGGAKVLDHAKMADYKALIDARKAVQKKDEYKKATKPMQEQMLTEAMASTMEKRRARRLDSRSKMEDYDAGIVREKPRRAPGEATASMTKFLRENNYLPSFQDSEPAEGSSSNNNNPEPGPYNHVPPSTDPGQNPALEMGMGMGMTMGSLPSASPMAAMTAPIPVRPLNHGVAMPAPPNPMDELSQRAAGGNINRNFATPSFIPAEHPFPFLPNPVHSFMANNGPMPPAPHQAYPVSSSPSLFVNHPMTPMSAPFHTIPNPPPPAAHFPRTSTATADGNMPGGGDVDSIRSILENLVPAVRNVTRHVDNLHTQVGQLRQELCAHTNRAGETDTKVVQAENDVQVLTSETVPQLWEALRKLETAVSGIETKVGQGSDAEMTKMRGVMRGFQDALNSAGGYN